MIPSSSTFHTIDVKDITGEFKTLFASAPHSTKGPKKLFIVSNISPFGVAPYVTFDVEINGKIYPFTDAEAAVNYYNKF